MRRVEDLRLITGQGLYTDDIVVAQSAQTFVLRSPVAHANIRRIDTARARTMPGVLLVAAEPLRIVGLSADARTATLFTIREQRTVLFDYSAAELWGSVARA